MKLFFGPAFTRACYRAVQQREPASQEEILQQLEQRVGPEGRRLLEGFFAKVKRLEQVGAAAPARKWSQPVLAR